MQGGGICSKEFVDFMHAVSGSFSSEQRLWEAIAAAIPPLVEKLHIGYLTVRMETQKNVLLPSMSKRMFFSENVEHSSIRP